MCARYTLSTPPTTLADLFDAELLIDVGPRFNIAPTQDIAGVRLTPEGTREMVMMRWGLIPSWAHDPAIGNKHLNARSETVGEKPSFREPIRYRRCLIPADGFFEWKTLENGKKQPYLIRNKNRQLLTFAGIWDRWLAPSGKFVDSCAILTVPANPLLQPLHERMPLILQPADHLQWLDPKVRNVEGLLPLFRTLAESELDLTPVSPKVNNARFDDPICIEATPEPDPEVRQLTLF